MNTEQTKNDTTAEEIVKELPLLPVLGFVFALCYESAYFFSLNIELRQILTLSDIIEASALKILPAIPLLLLGFWVGSSQESAQPSDMSRPKKILADVPFTLIKYTVFFSATIYLLFGLPAQIGFMSLALSSLLIFANIIIFPALAHSDRVTFMTVWLLIITIVTFASMGYNDAHKIRFGDRSNLPDVLIQKGADDIEPSEYKLVRRLSSGLLLTTQNSDQLLFLQNDTSSSVIFEMNTAPFKGILCGGFGWCPLPLLK
ncbi:hypothetical protein [Amylibacter sp. IMCC11727]|uniref:hypothetical protein n=1 Tax=Amylibacter sp. IMCC11727 TaxID=3039851 RepID=UPI00244DC7EE|nr:hypothetical protein [Amylibacter sp. IMCC11727]WGI23349.1 hypothetical protein QBD29_07970 [Amylibacter sp. IMCC11727]